MARHLVVKSSGGMSNRLQAVLAGLAYARLSGRAIHVDWRDSLYSDDLTNVFPRLFSLKGIDQSAELPTSGSVFPAFWQERLDVPLAVEYFFDNNHLSPEVIGRTCIDWSRYDYHQDTVVCWSPDLSPLSSMLQALGRAFPDLAGLRAEALARRLYLDHLQVCGEVAEAVREFRKTRFSRPVVGIHIRHTDMRSPLEAFILAARKLADSLDADIFLATDNHYVQRTFDRLFPRLLHTDKLLSRNGEPLHGYDPMVSSERKAREALVDMLLLAECSHIVRYRLSSFATIPIILAGLGPDRVTEIT